MQDPTPRYVYICSAGHSGSTLLDLLLGSHSKIESLGEISQLSKNLALNTPCTCGKPVRECPVWVQVVSRLSETLGLDVMQNPYELHLGYPRAVVVVDKSRQTRSYLLVRKALLSLYYLRLRYNAGIVDPLLRSIEKSVTNSFLVFNAFRELLGVDIVVDSSKSYLRALSLYRRDPEHVRILLLTRDGRGVAWSNIKRGATIKDAVSGWRNQYARALPLFRRHVASEHILQVQYEDVVANSSEALARICDFLGQKFEPGMLNFASTVHHSTNGNDIRMLRSSTLRPDTEWQRNLTPADLAYFQNRAGRLNRALGYETP